MSTIFVVGSLNADYVVHVERIPQVGETLPGGDLALYPGGKGGNQAVAAAGLGGRVRMIGQIGEDAAGRFLLESQISAGVDVSGIGKIAGASGCALIYIVPSGDNSIVISPAANGRLTPTDARERLRGIGPQDFLLCQLETPLETVAEALKIARAAGATTILDPAPACALSQDILQGVDILTPNETEAAALLGASPAGAETEAVIAANALRAMGPRTVILKLGERGCVVADGSSARAISAFAVEAVDTTAAGDTFNAALAVQLGAGADIVDAARWANAAAAVSVTRKGAQPSAPTHADVDRFLAERSVEFSPKA